MIRTCAELRSSPAGLLFAAASAFVPPPAGPPNKVTERVARDTPLTRGAIAAIIGALRLADLQGFDPQPDNVVATGSFCFAPPGAAPQQVRPALSPLASP